VNGGITYWVFDDSTPTLSPQCSQTNAISSSMPRGAAWGAPPCGHRTRAPVRGGRKSRCGPLFTFPDPARERRVGIKVCDGLLQQGQDSVYESERFFRHETVDFVAQSDLDAAVHIH
jgi:hypothetical protein